MGHPVVWRNIYDNKELKQKVSKNKKIVFAVQKLFQSLPILNGMKAIFIHDLAFNLETSGFVICSALTFKQI